MAKVLLPQHRSKAGWFEKGWSADRYPDKKEIFGHILLGGTPRSLRPDSRRLGPGHSSYRTSKGSVGGEGLVLSWTPCRLCFCHWKGLQCLKKRFSRNLKNGGSSHCVWKEKKEIPTKPSSLGLLAIVSPLFSGLKEMRQACGFHSRAERGHLSGGRVMPLDLLYHGGTMRDHPPPSHQFLSRGTHSPNSDTAGWSLSDRVKMVSWCMPVEPSCRREAVQPWAPHYPGLHQRDLFK